MVRTARRWDLWNEFDRLQNEFTRMFTRGVGESARAVFPAVNLWHNAEEVLMTAELPGMEPDQIDVTVTRQSVTLKGRRGTDVLKEGESFYRQERPATEFERTIELPVEIDPQTHEATYERGVLALRLRRPAEHKPQKVTIKVG